MLRKSLFTFIVIGTTVLLGNCATMQEPDEKHLTLLVGTVAVHAIAPGFDADTKTDGTYREGIQITIQNRETKAIYELRSDRDGLFLTRGLPSGWFFFKRLYYRGPESKNGLELDGPGGEIYFNIVSGKVNNLGRVDWYVGRVGYKQFIVSKDYNEVHDQLYLFS